MKIEDLKSQEDLDKLLKETAEKASEKTAKNAESAIADLETQLSLKSDNPLKFPRVKGAKGEIFELPFLNPLVIRFEKNGDLYTVENQHLTDDKKANLDFGMDAKDLLAKIYKTNEKLFVKK